MKTIRTNSSDQPPDPKDGKVICLGCGRRGDGWMNIRHTHGCSMVSGKGKRET